MSPPPTPLRTDENRAYHSDTEYVSKSALDKIRRAPALYYATYLDPNRRELKPTPAMQLGSLFHTICLEPERAEQEYAVAPDGLDRRTKEGKAWVAENVEKQIVSAADWQMVAEMREALLRNTEIAEILKSGVAEQPVRTLHPDLFVGIKAKPDWFDPQSGVILDLKTTTDASPTEFAKSVHKFRYHVQEAFYRDVLAAEGIEVTRFIFAAIEKEYPYLVATYELDDEAVGHGRLLYTQDLAVYAECLERGVWPGYAPTTQRLSLPAYAFR